MKYVDVVAHSYGGAVTTDLVRVKVGGCTYYMYVCMCVYT